MSDTVPTLLLTNDDGWDAPGLAALDRAAGTLGRPWIVAPSGPISGCGHRVTTHGPLVVTRAANGSFAVAGTPADCVRLALHHLVPRPSWVLAGINAGGNLGTDIHYSGTVAAVREGAIHGVPGIALSQYHARGRAIDWRSAGRWAEAIVHAFDASAMGNRHILECQFPPSRARRARARDRLLPLDPSPLPLFTVSTEKTPSTRATISRVAARPEVMWRRVSAARSP